jgi:putative ABC transport system permease protein
MHNWLGHYTYHTELSWWVFALTGIGSIAIALGTVSYQSLKAAIVNPVNSLKAN